ncbi:MAG: branched-chain amino acid ABC transporter permease [Actinomycetota bacterium]|nr:branched-chain amino acid ABC transporter permease [Actinomycetota bacterium]MDQ3354695.1 branched-chain amino acid ABC transporter permease [Actinomycetota bacterium]
MAHRLLLMLAAMVGMSILLASPVGAQAAENTGEGVRGTIVDEDDEPVEGVEITVADAAGETVGTATTGADGIFQLEVPGPGNYSATIDDETLGDLTLRNPDRATLEFPIREGQQRTLLFPLGEGDREIGGTLARVLQLLVEGVKFGLIIAMASVGLSLIFGTTGLINFAHGEMVTFGALVGWFVNVTLGLHFVPATVVAVVIGGLAGAGLDKALWRPLRRRGTGLIALLVISIGLGLLVRYLFLYQFGGRTRPFAQYAVQRAIDLGPVAIAPKDIFSIILSLAVLAAVGLALLRTKAGKAMRAVADNPDLAASSGIDVERVILLVWFFGGGLAALGGVLLGLTEQVSWQMGVQLLLLMFAGVILGGLGTAFGALVGSFVVGVFIQLSTLVVAPELKNVGALAILILILLVRPQGLLGQPERLG